MAVEIEAKFRVGDPEAVRRALATADGQWQGACFEVNTILDAPDRRLRKAGCGLRVRMLQPTPPAAAAGSAGGAAASERRAAGRASCGDAWPGGYSDANAGVLTFKGPREASGDDLKVRAEFETTVGDVGATLAVLAQLGFEPVVIYEKRRSTWRVARCSVTLDELPQLGWFVEIEGPTAADVADVRARLGLTTAPVVRETYVEMTANHGSETVDPRTGSAVRRLVF